MRVEGENRRFFSSEVIKFLEEKKKKLMPEVNIGTVGHVDHGKTSLVHTLTGKWTDTHSEEIKRGITIRLGYADCTFYYCEKCKSYSSSGKCPKCFEDCVAVRAVSFVDAPGHEALMATVLSGASLMDGALLLIAANEECPQLQTAEHLKVLDIVGIKNIVIVQNKIDLVSEEEALRNYNQIKAFVKGTVAENAPVIPISAIHSANIDLLIAAIQEKIPTPKRNLDADPRFFIARSFDINKPGTSVEKLKGGVIGGSIISGKIRKNDIIEIRPGIKIDEKWTPLESRVVEIVQSGERIEEATPGGLVALQTELDPAITRGDGLAGNIAGLKDKLPQVKDELNLKLELFDYIIGVSGNQKVDPIKTGDVLMLTAAIAKSVGVVTSAGKTCMLKLKLPVCAEKNDKVALSKQISGRWHLIGYGIAI